MSGKCALALRLSQDSRLATLQIDNELDELDHLVHLCGSIQSQLNLSSVMVAP